MPVLLTFAVILGCASQTSDSNPASGTGVETTEQAPAPEVGPSIPDGDDGTGSEAIELTPAPEVGLPVPDGGNGTGSEPIELTPAPEVGHPAPDFVLEDLDGNLVRLSDFRGKVVLINFWTTWCPACRIEMPEIEAVHQEYKDKGVVVLGVDPLEDEGTIRRYIQQGGFSWTILLDITGEVARDYEITAIPTSFFLDTEGIIRVVNVGDMTREAMEGMLTEAMQ
ncbi:MAG: TlpA disulfide reductase family protein [Dehalococcoidia bacterium]